MHSYTFPEEYNNERRVMYITKVLLGRIKDYQETSVDLSSPPDGFHSVHGFLPWQPNLDEYIIYRYGQALPIVKITYRA